MCLLIGGDHWASLAMLGQGPMLSVECVCTHTCALRAAKPILIALCNCALGFSVFAKGGKTFVEPIVNVFKLQALLQKIFWQLDGQEGSSTVGTKPVSAENIAAFTAFASTAAMTKLVDNGIFLSSEPILHDLSSLWSSPHLATVLRDEKERLAKLGICDPFSFVEYRGHGLVTCRREKRANRNRKGWSHSLVGTKEKRLPGRLTLVQWMAPFEEMPSFQFEETFSHF